MKICENCGREISDLSADCKYCSKKKVNLVELESEPDTIDESELKNILSNDWTKKIIIATRWSRFINYIVDSFVIYFIYIVGFWIISWFFLDNKNDDVFWVFAVIITLMIPLYYIICEAVWWKTLGKLITRTKVLDETWWKASLGKIIWRTVCRIIPFERFSYLFNSERPIWWHDSISGTITVSERN